MKRHLFVIALAGLTATACATADRITQVGSTPQMSPIDNPALYAGSPAYGSPQANPAYYPPQQQQAQQQPQYQPPVQQPYTQAGYAAPTQQPYEYGSSPTNSLWAPGARTFFGDPRASRPGDILTVNINISDSAQVQNTTNRSRTATENSNLTNFLGGEAALSSFFNDAIDPSSLTSFGSNGSHAGTGLVNRQETINLSVAAVVSQALPNGNLAIMGRQEVRINNEVRELLISGVVRPEDIASDNTILHTQIAEARISYGGRGHISDVQRPRLGQELYDIIWPF
jgi:flagellar L-ring protein FlgH